MSLGLLADVGDSYRYKATLKLTDNREITGYFYFHTYKKGFNEAKTDFKTYILNYYYFPITIYENIKTIEIDQYVTVDFAIEGTGIKVNKSEIVSLNLIGQLKVEVGDRIIEVNKTEFGLITQDFICTESYYNESYSENCRIYLLSWSGENNLTVLKTEIAKNIDRLTIAKNELSTNKYIETKREELIRKGVLLFRYCGAL